MVVYVDISVTEKQFNDYKSGKNRVVFAKKIKN